MDIPNTFRNLPDLARVSNAASDEPMSLHASLSQWAVGSGCFSSWLESRSPCMGKQENIRIVLRRSLAGVICTDGRANAIPGPPEQNPANKMDQHLHCEQ